MIRARRGLTTEMFGQLMQQVCPSDAEQDAELERLLAKMDAKIEKRQAKKADK